MRTIPFVQLLLLFVVSSVCVHAVIVRPLAPPKIRPLYVRSAYNRATNNTSYYMLFSGPADTRDNYNLPLTVKNGGSIDSESATIFEARTQVAFGDRQRIELQSNSASEMFRMSIQGKELDADQRFSDAICEYEVRRETESTTTEYSSVNNNCRYKPEIDLDVYTYFTVSLTKGDQLLRFVEFDEVIKNYVNRTSTSLILNEENMRKDGYSLTDASFWILSIYLRPSEIVNGFGWNFKIV